MNKALLSVADFSPTDFSAALERTGEMKRLFASGKPSPRIRGNVIGLLFEKPSTRTRTSFEAATLRLGGDALYLASNELQLSRGEPVKDTARVLGGYLDAIVARVYLHHTLEQLAEFSGLPVVNGLSDREHPTQALSDLFTIMEFKGELSGLTLAYIGDGNNVCNSLLLGAALTGMHFRSASPPLYEPRGNIVKEGKAMASKTGGSITIYNKPKDAAVGADVLYTDVWVSMGQEKEREQRLSVFSRYQINKSLLSYASKDAIVMHCLPAHRGLEITTDMLEGPRSVVWVQARNKLYGAAAVIDLALAGR